MPEDIKQTLPKVFLRKIKILFTIPNFLTAGSGREMFNIIERLDKTKFDVTIAIKTEGGRLFEEIKAKGYPVLIVDFNAEGNAGFLRTIIESIRISRFFNQYHFDIWQSFNWSSDYSEALVAKFSGAKYVYVKKNMNWERKAWKVKSYLSNAIVARNSTMMKRFFSTGGFRNKTYFISGGVNADFYARNHVQDIRKQFGLNQDDFVITCVAQIVRVKDQATLLRALAKVGNVRLVLAGADRDRIYMEELRALAQDLGIKDRVILAGGIADVRSLLHNSDLFVLPTSKQGDHEEGCPVAMLEAMAASVPCIASNVAGSNDLVIHEETGLLFEPGDAGALAACIERCIKFPAEAAAYAAIAHARVKMNNTLEKEAEEFSQLYGNMVFAKW